MKITIEMPVKNKNNKPEHVSERWIQEREKERENANVLWRNQRGKGMGDGEKGAKTARVRILLILPRTKACKKKKEYSSFNFPLPFSFALAPCAGLIGILGKRRGKPGKRRQMSRRRVSRNRDECILRLFKS